MTLVKCTNLNKSFDRIEALKNINLELTSGKIIGLLGANGSGKTTLLKLINDLIKPSSGEVIINNTKPGIESKKIISYLPERTYLDLEMKADEAIEYFNDFYNDFDRDKAYRMLSEMQITTDVKMKTLSKGTKEKIQLALVMSRKADLYVLDEPIGGVDPAGRDFIIETILNNFNEDATLLISTHLIADIEAILDEIIFIDKGSIVLHENAEELRYSRKMSIDSIFREEFKC
ncbi:MAG: ABC transporter ATP-binding protein [Coprobacillaceae bacterium]